MDNLIFIITILFLILGIYYIDYTSGSDNLVLKKENFIDCQKSNNHNQDVLSLNPYYRCKVLGVQKFMIRDRKTNLWLTDGLQEGFSKFLPGRFGIPLMMSNNPDEYLPLRTVVDPNDYLLATYNGKGIRVVSNPNSKFFILQIFIYNGFNIIGYINEKNTYLYLIINSNGNIESTKEPNNASTIEIVEI